MSKCVTNSNVEVFKKRNINELPESILVKIFKLFPWHSRFAFELVCSKWNSLIDFKDVILNDISIKSWINVSIESFKTISIISKMLSRKYARVIEVEMNGELFLMIQSLECISSFTYFLKKLNVTSSINSQLLSSVRRFKYLQSLSLSFEKSNISSDDIFKELSCVFNVADRLKSLCFANISRVKMVEFQLFLSSTVGAIEDLKMENIQCQVIPHPSLGPVLTFTKLKRLVISKCSAEFYTLDRFELPVVEHLELLGSRFEKIRLPAGFYKGNANFCQYVRLKYLKLDSINCQFWPECTHYLPPCLESLFLLPNSTMALAKEYLLALLNSHLNDLRCLHLISKYPFKYDFPEVDKLRNKFNHLFELNLPKANLLALKSV